MAKKRFIFMFIFIVVFGLASIVGLASMFSAGLAFAIPSAIGFKQPSLAAITDEYVFNISLRRFITNRNRHVGPAGLDWTSNGCSHAPDNPFSFNFQDPCIRHDFSYRNFKKQHRFTDANKERLDTQFRKDMHTGCRSQTFQILCEAIADAYYAAVIVFGKDKTVEKQAAEILAAEIQAAKLQAAKLEEEKEYAVRGEDE